jgi:GntR family transcriptional regulator/MocR family aminotransferase
MASTARFEWTTSGLDLHLALDAAPGGLRERLENELRDAIRSGRLARGTRLPSSRSLARDLGISRGTTVAAYAQLAVEGWIAGERGSGTVVTAGPARASEPAAVPEARAWRYELRPTLPDPTSFPRTEWLRALRRALAAAPDDAFAYGDPEGTPVLRTELARYLSRARGVQVEPQNLIVTTGFTQSLNLIARAIAPGTIAMEEPSMLAHREIVRDLGHELLLLPVDAEGADVSHLGSADAVLLTPSRQHVLGATLSPARRTQVLDWARDTGGLVVENDYDGEFRYDIRPLVPLQALEPAHVVYAGTTSKSIAPGLRIAWLVVPDALVAPLARLKHHADALTGVLEQLAFAEFLRSGAYDRHVRKQRLRYRRRRDALLAALPPGLPVSGASGGLNVIVHLPDEAAEREALAAAAARGLGLSGLIAERYYEGSPRAGLIVGYAAAPEHAYGQALAALVAALRDCGLYADGSCDSIVKTTARRSRRKPSSGS